MSRERLRQRRSALVRLVTPPLVGTLGRLPWALAQKVGAGFGAIAWHASKRDRRLAIEHVGLAFPELSESECRRRARASFRNLGTTLGECLWMLYRDCDALSEHLEIEGWEHPRQVARDGRPLIFVTGHCGNWETLAAVIGCGEVGLAVVARHLDDPTLSQLILRLRSRYGTDTIEREQPGSARKLLRALRQGSLGMLIDQDINAQGVWVPFFGRLAHTPVGAAQIALRQNAAVIPCFDERLPDGSHVVRFLPPMELPNDPVEATAAITTAIENQIRRFPEQWVWVHRRWRRRPPVAESGP